MVQEALKHGPFLGDFDQDQEEEDKDRRGNEIMDHEREDFPFPVSPGLNLPVVSTSIVDPHSGKRRLRDLEELNELTLLCRERIASANGNLIAVVVLQHLQRSPSFESNAHATVPGLLFAFEVPKEQSSS